MEVYLVIGGFADLYSEITKLIRCHIVDVFEDKNIAEWVVQGFNSVYNEAGINFIIIPMELRNLNLIVGES